MPKCPHCGSHDIMELPEYRAKIDGYELERSQPQLHAFCNDCENEFGPDDKHPPCQLNKGDPQILFRSR